MIKKIFNAHVTIGVLVGLSFIYAGVSIALWEPSDPTPIRTMNPYTGQSWDFLAWDVSKGKEHGWKVVDYNQTWDDCKANMQQWKSAGYAVSCQVES